jgi:hypothetical protein
MYTLSYVNLRDVMADLGVDDDNQFEKIVETYFDWVTFGDPFVGTDVVVDSLRQYWEDTSSSIETLTEQYWSLVGDSDYINLES